MDVQLKLLSILENPAVIVAAAANGEVSIMRDFLKKHPNEVCVELVVYNVEPNNNCLATYVTHVVFVARDRYRDTQVFVYWSKFS